MCERETPVRAVILAGGRGTRVAELSDGLPKPMLEIGGEPVLLHTVKFLRCEGVCEIVIVTGYRAEQIEAYFGDGAAFGVHISYYREPEPLGTGGALFRLGLTGDFLLCGGDLLMDFSLRDFLAFHRETHALVTLFAHPSSHPQDSTLLDTDADGIVRRILPPGGRNGFYTNLTNAGVQLVSPAFLQLFSDIQKADFDRDLLLPALKSGRIYAYRSSEYVKDMGTPERLAQVRADFSRGLPQKKNRRQPQRAVFLDRDGVLNRYCGYVTSPDALTLCPGAAEGVALLNRLGLLAIVVTNQPVVARGDCTFAELAAIHQKLETLLGEQGAYLDAIYVCPHHPDAGFPGENRALKIRCNCRKPNTGLIEQAAKAFHIDAAASYLAGDSLTDIRTAENAGCQPVFILSALGQSPPDGVPVFQTLLQFAESLAEKE